MSFDNKSVDAGDHISVPGGLKDGSKLTIRGRVEDDPQAVFSVNLMLGKEEGDDIALTFNPRNLKGGNSVVRNSFKDGVWGEEEKDTPSFPFKSGERFSICIETETNHYRILVNEKDYVNFYHRDFLPPSKVRYVYVTSGANWSEVKYES